jgi:hypothetical protein
MISGIQIPRIEKKDLHYLINSELLKLGKLNKKLPVSQNIQVSMSINKDGMESFLNLNLEDEYNSLLLQELSQYQNWVLGTSSNTENLPIQSLRLPDVPGTHELYFSSKEDEIVLSHIAHNRDGFANGAILSAEFLIGKKGVFTIKDVFGLNY